MKTKEKQVVFTDSGMFVAELEAGSVILTKDQIESAKRYKESQEALELRVLRSKKVRGEDFIKQIISPELKGILSGIDGGHVLECAVRISYKRGNHGDFIIMSDINSRKPANFNDMCKIFATHKGEGKKLTATNTQKIIDRLEKQEIIKVTRGEDKGERTEGEKYNGRIDENLYELNSKFFAKGTTSDVMFTKFYLKNFKEMTKGLSPSEKGFLLEMAPYFHYDLYVLCRNPHEPDLSKVEYFTVDALTKELKTSRQTITKKISALKKAGIMGTFNSHGVSALYLHPDLVFKLDVKHENEEETDKIREQFKTAKVMAQTQTIMEKNKTYNLFNSEITDEE